MLRRQLHQRSASIDQRHSRPDPGKCHRRALVDLDLQAVGNKSHHAGRFHPRNLLQLRLLLRQRNEKDVAPDIGAHHFHDLRLGHVLHAGDFNVVARFHAEAPRVLAIVIQPGRAESGHAHRASRHGGPQQTVCSFLRKRTSAGGDPLLPAQKRRFLVHIQVDQTRVVHLQIMPAQIMETLARRFSAGWVQLFLQDGGARFPRHQFRSVVVEESLSLQTITLFRRERQTKYWILHRQESDWTSSEEIDGPLGRADKNGLNRRPTSRNSTWHQAAAPAILNPSALEDIDITRGTLTRTRGQTTTGISTVLNTTGAKRTRATCASIRARCPSTRASAASCRADIASK